MRLATPEDSSTVTALGVATELFPADQTEVTDTMMADYFGGHHERGHRCFMCETEQGAIGMVYVLPKPATEGTWELLMMAVRPDHQGQGHGTALLKEVETELHQKGGRLLLVETSGTPEFAQTRSFYAQCGYREEARIRDYYDQGADMVLFRKVLSSP